jgi:hypothetical protein
LARGFERHERANQFSSLTVFLTHIAGRSELFGFHPRTSLFPVHIPSALNTFRPGFLADDSRISF